MANEKLLEIKNLTVHYQSYDATVHAVENLNLSLGNGETLGLVGETGAGKTTTVKSIMRILPTPPARVVSGEIFFDGQDLLKVSEKEMRKIRGKEIAMIFQDPMTSLNPVMTVADQIAEVIRLHDGGSRAEAHKKACDMLELVGIRPERGSDYPHQFSGGMKQRVVIAMALACNPRFLIADEPTTALDVTIQAQILNLIKKLNRQFGMTTMLITHDLGVVATVCDKVAVMYGGLIMEYGTADEIFYHPRHPYTMGLLGSIPHVDGGEKHRLIPIDGTPPDLINPPKGCPFSTRCKYCMNVCTQEQPPYFAEDKHRTMCWMLDADAPKDSDYEMRKAGVNYGR